MSRESAAVRVLLVSRDIQTIEFICHYMQKLAMHVETACDVESATRKLCRCKFEGVIIDLELGDEALQLLKKLRDLTSHRHAISFVIVGNEIETGIEYKPHATFVLRRPFSAPSVIRNLRASYPLMFRERRRDYRYPVEMRTIIGVDSTELTASSINISETGIAIHSSTPLDIGTRVQLRLDLPGVAESLNISGEVRWTDPKGRTGIHFLEVPRVVSERLQLWLAERMTELVPRC
jgi:ActR/RegA family two-component response regulator/Tfp pilus assembly protein PilZ